VGVGWGRGGGGGGVGGWRAWWEGGRDGWSGRECGGGVIWEAMPRGSLALAGVVT